MTSLQTLFDDHQHYHTTLQCRSFITAKAGVTPFGQYRQTLRELTSRTWSAFEEMLRMEELRCDIEEATEKVTKIEDSPLVGDLDKRDRKLRRARLKLARKEIELTQLEASTTDRLREWAEFYAQAVTLRGQLGLVEGEQLDEKTRERLETEMFAQQFVQTMKARAATGHAPLDPNLYQIIDTLPDDWRVPLIEASESAAKLRALEERLPAMQLPEPMYVPSIEEARALVRERLRTLPLGYTKVDQLAPAE